MKKENRFFGIVLIVFGLFLTVNSSQLYYYYNFTEINFTFMYPTYELVARFFLGLALTPTGALIFLNKINGFKMLRGIGWGMIIYGVFRFVINFEYWKDELFDGLIYILTGFVFIGILRRKFSPSF